MVMLPRCLSQEWRKLVWIGDSTCIVSRIHFILITWVIEIQLSENAESAGFWLNRSSIRVLQT